jgi:peptidyl-prolyl cis-trans isomerase B (cyclophilin B)
VIDLDSTDLATLEAVMETDKGTMVIGFHPEAAPAHVKNFCKLAEQQFYDGLAFHRIVRNFMVQGGCPNTKPGARATPGLGGPGYTIPAEFSQLPHKRGVLSMARARDPNSAGSQFFIVHAEHADSLDGKYTVFGQVKQGLEVLDAIAGTEVDFGPGGERSKPKSRVGIKSVRVRQAEVQSEAQAGGAS